MTKYTKEDLDKAISIVGPGLGLIEANALAALLAETREAATKDFAEWLRSLRTLGLVGMRTAIDLKMEELEADK